MDQIQKAKYEVVVGKSHSEVGMRSIVIVAHMLPKIGEHDFKWVKAEVIGKEYGHYGYRLHPKASPVNVHVYGDSKLVEYMARSGRPAKCELELVKKTVTSGRSFVLVNLYLTKPHARVTHSLAFVHTGKATPPDVYTTFDMRGVGIKVKQEG